VPLVLAASGMNVPSPHATLMATMPSLGALVFEPGAA
jgi:hypothetical protein